MINALEYLEQIIVITDDIKKTGIGIKKSVDDLAKRVDNIELKLATLKRETTYDDEPIALTMEQLILFNRKLDGKIDEKKVPELIKSYRDEKYKEFIKEFKELSVEDIKWITPYFDMLYFDLGTKITKRQLKNICILLWILTLMTSKELLDKYYNIFHSSGEFFIHCLNEIIECPYTEETHKQLLLTYINEKFK
jgi:hypothetical protein